MEKLRIERHDVYTIEVNDNGDVITFDLTDVDLPLRFEKCLEDLNKLSSYAKEKELIISKQQDEKGKGYLTKNQLAQAKLMSEMYAESRKVIDNLLGENACYKIFGKTNYLNMFDDLFRALEPHIKKMGLNQKKAVDLITKKYEKMNDEELS